MSSFCGTTFFWFLFFICIYSPMYSTGLRTLPAVVRAMSGKRQFARTSPFDALMRMKDHLFASKGFVSPMTETDPGKVPGTSYTVIKYPDPTLRAHNDEVTVFDDKLQQIAKEMLMIMYAADGIGLAAPQIGINQRLMVFNEEGEVEEGEEMILVNPKIIQLSEEKKVGKEGCLSFPKIHGRVERHQWVEVQYQNLEGTSLKHRFTGLSSVIFQHEYDHLDKVLFIDRFIEQDKKKVKNQLERLVTKFGPGAAA